MSSPLETAEDWMALHGYRPPAPTIDQRYIVGPIRLRAVLTDATATDSYDCFLEASVLKDPNIVEAYGHASGSGKLDAKIHCQGIVVDMWEDAFRDLDPAIKDDIYDELKLEVKRDGKTYWYQLGRAIVEAFSQTNELQTTAADQTTAMLKGKLLKFAETFTLSMKTDVFKIHTTASISHGGLNPNIWIAGFVYPPDAAHDAGVESGGGCNVGTTVQTMIQAADAEVLLKPVGFGLD